jgi:hypothetical protein
MVNYRVWLHYQEGNNIMPWLGLAGAAGAGAGATAAGVGAAGTAAATGAATLGGTAAGLGAAGGTAGALGGTALGTGVTGATGAMGAGAAGALGSSALPGAATMAIPAMEAVPATLPAAVYTPAGVGITGASSAPSFMNGITNVLPKNLKEATDLYKQGKEIYDLMSPKSGGVPGQQGSPATLTPPQRKDTAMFQSLPPEIQRALAKYLR